ncbi:MAG: response regulator, partial [Planctomycetes bacterium]|nr:response regulator [Planctomycetota bacterium]
MPKRVLSVGQCVPDHTAISRMLKSRFGVEVVAADKADDALAALRGGPIDLVLVNRKLDCDYTDGLEIIRQIKADEALKDVPCMLISNYAEHQETATEAGAEYGFGKAELEKPETQ